MVDLESITPENLDKERGKKCRCSRYEISLEEAVGKFVLFWALIHHLVKLPDNGFHVDLQLKLLVNFFWKFVHILLYAF